MRLRPTLALVVSLSAVTSIAEAYDAEVAATTSAQAYSLRSPFGDPILMRRRITQTLSLGVYDLLDNETPGGPQLLVKMRFRFDADLGVDANERTFSRGDPTSRYVPGLQEAPLDLMYGYVEGRHFFHGYFDFKVGRQYLTDALGWWSFDGGLARLNVPYAHVEAYGGFEQRGGLPLSTGRYESHGVARGDRSDIPYDVYPNFQAAKTAPAWGVAAESAGPQWIHARIDYRKVWNQGQVTTLPFADGSGRLATVNETRTSSERLGFAADASFWEKVGAKGNLVYDLYNGFFSQYGGSLDGYLGKKVTLSADYDYFRPTFDGDSIFNWFTHNPMTTIDGRVGVAITDRVDVAATGGIRRWETDDDPTSPTLLAASALTSTSPQSGALQTATEVDNPAHMTDFLGSVSGRVRYPKGKATLRGVWESGQRGRREGVDVGGDRLLHDGVYMVSARGSVFDWRDDLRPDRSATSVGYVLGAGWRPADEANVMLEWEHNTNRLVGQRYRILAVLNLLVMK